jgi:hypothetical protein
MTDDAGGTKQRQQTAAARGTDTNSVDEDDAQRAASLDPSAADRHARRDGRSTRLRYAMTGALLVTVVLLAWLSLGSKDDAVTRCLRVALAEQQSIAAKADLVAAAQTVKSGKLDVSSNGRETVKYRQVSDDTVRSAIEVCRAVHVSGKAVPQSAGELRQYKPQSITIEGASPLITVSRKLGQRAIPAVGVDVFSEQAAHSCVTGDNGQCALPMTQQEANHEVTVRIKTKGGDVSKRTLPMLELVQRGLELEAPAEFSRIDFNIVACRDSMPLRNVNVAVDAPSGLFWSTSCGRQLPEQLGECREHFTRDGKASYYYDRSTLTTVNVIVEPDGAERERYPLQLPFDRERLELRYPKNCDDKPVKNPTRKVCAIDYANFNRGKPDCPRGYDSRPPTPSERERLASAHPRCGSFRVYTCQE